MTVKKFEMTVPLRLGEPSPCVPPLPGPLALLESLRSSSAQPRAMIPEALLVQLSPLKWEHIDLTAVCSVGITSPDAF